MDQFWSAGPASRRSDEPGGESSEARVLFVARPALEAALQAAIESAGACGRGLRNPADAGAAVEAWKPHVVLVDGQLDDPVELCTRIRGRHECATVLLVSAVGCESLTLAELCGADTAMPLPLDASMLRRFLQREARGAQRGDGRGGPVKLPRSLIGACLPMRQVWRLVLLASQSDTAVMIAGEAGTGRELLARAIHRFSVRRRAPFVAVRCAALSEQPLESELFGAHGAVEAARGGTLYLEDIHELTPALQDRLLRALPQRPRTDDEGNESEPELRVIASSRKQLEDEAAQGRFRADLLYALNVLSIGVPPLRERGGDVLSLWQNAIADGAAREGRPAPATATDVQRALLKHDWPGNLRELYNTAQHALTVVAGPSITPDDLPPALAAAADRPRSAASGSLVGMTLRELERAAILDTYAAVGTVIGAAAMLDISPRKIHYRLNEYKQQGLFPQKPPQGPSAPAPDEPPPPPARRARVLLAEDDDDLRWTLADLLKSEGYEVLAVPNGRVFLEQLGHALLVGNPDLPADVIVTDVRMPGITGMQILERIRERGWKVPVVLISAYGDRDVRARAERLGAAFLPKPLDFDVLQRIIAESVN